MAKLREPTREMIVKEAREYLLMAYQDAEEIKYDDAEGSAYIPLYVAKAEALIELLEVVDCGSAGGYDDPTRRRGRQRDQTLEGRLKWVAEKYKGAGK